MTNLCIKCNKYPAEQDEWCWLCYLRNGQELKAIGIIHNQEEKCCPVPSNAKFLIKKKGGVLK